MEEKREAMRDCIKGLERRMKEGAGKRELEEVDVRRGKIGGRVMVENRLIEIEKKIEIRKRKERRRNIIIKRVQVKDDKREEAVKKVLKILGVRADMEEIRRLGD